jgi:hypothetical protein
MTGVFAYFSDGGRDGWQSPREQVAGNMYSRLWMWSERYAPENVHVAIERYIITQQTAKLSQQPDALEVTGLAKGLAQIHGVTDVRQYMKANLKFASDSMLRSVGWSTPGMRHANDAARQAFALLKEVDYPRWSKMVADAKLDTEDERTR